MTRDELAEAAEVLEAAAENAPDEAADRLRSQARQLASLAEADRGPDHGRMARHQQALREIKATVDASIAADIEEADDLINAYRSTVQGV